MKYNVFLNSLFFVLGFSSVFTFLGVILQVFFPNLFFLKEWIYRIGGLIIIFFGLYLLGLIKFDFLLKQKKLFKHKNFDNKFLTSYVFGASFAAGWTPCIGAVLGAILTLAFTNSSTAILLMITYSLGLGIPFLIIGLFADKVIVFVKKFNPYINLLNNFFGVLLIILGVLVFTNHLSTITNLTLSQELLFNIETNLGFSNTLNFGVAFLAGIISFFNPCVFPLLPGFLAYLGGVSVKK